MLPTPVFWPGKFHGLHSPWGCKESDMTVQISLNTASPGIQCPIISQSLLEGCSNSSHSFAPNFYFNKVKSLNHVRLFVIPWTKQSVEFSRPEYWSGQPFPSPRDLPNPGIEPRSPALPGEPQGKCNNNWSGQPIASLADLPKPGIKSVSPALQADSLPTEQSGKPLWTYISIAFFYQESLGTASLLI